MEKIGIRQCGDLSPATSSRVSFAKSALAYTLPLFSLGICLGVTPQRVEAATYTYDNTTTGALSSTATSCATPMVRQFNVADNVTVQDVNLGFNADHTYRGDIQVTLRHPDGTSVQVMTSNGSDGSDGYDVLLDSSSGNALNDGNADSTAAPLYDRTAAPSNSLASFNGKTSNGTWTLEVCDTFNGDDGTFNSAQLILDDTAPPIDPSLPTGERPFSLRYSVETTGNIEATGNAVLTCDTGSAACTSALSAGTVGNNNGGLAMQMLDVDSDGSTFNSSSAQLTIPAGANVLFAGLYWGGTSDGATTAAPDSSKRNEALLATPSSGYQTVTADTFTSMDNSGTTGWDVYNSFADVTSLVQGAGSGTYTMANVQTSTGTGFTYPNAGWSLVVVYEDPTEPRRNLTVFDGYQFTSFGSSITNTLSGLRTPPTSGFEVFMGAVAGDGEIDSTGDHLAINGTQVSDALNPATNFFNGTISKFGSHITTRTPNNPFNLVIDIDYLDLTSWNQTNTAIPTNATSIDVTLGTDGDGIWPMAYFFGVEVFEPNLVTQFEKTTPSTSYANGDTIPYTISVTNTGNDNSVDTVITDAIPTGTTFLPGSLKINGVTKTDGATDEAEFDGTNVIFRIGTGANTTQGGQLNINDTVTMSFDVVVTAAPGDVVCNQATIDYEGQASGNTASGNSDDPNTPTFGDCTEITTTASTAEDYGDAPDTYGTTAANGGASHTIVAGVHLGTVPDSEADAATPLDGTSDGADDGIILATLTEGDTSYSISATDITTTNTTGGPATLHAWVDFDGSDTFEPDEYTSQIVQSGNSNPDGALSWSGAGVSGLTGNTTTYARFRLTTDGSIDANTPGGAASDGEVEDYQVEIAQGSGGPASPDIPFAACEVPTSFIPDGTEDLSFPRGYWAASYYEGVDGSAGSASYGIERTGTGTAGSKIFHGEAFWGIGENPITVASNGSAANNRWSQVETPTSPPAVLHHPDYVGDSWTSSGNPYYQIDLRRQVDATGTITFGFGATEVMDDTLEVFVNGTRVYAYFPGGGAPDPRPGQGVGATINVTADDEVLIRFMNLGFIGGFTYEFKAPDVDCSDLPADGSTAPDGTAAATAYGNAPHIITSGLHLGTDVDIDASGVSSPDAAGDGVDDNGISAFPTLTAGDSDYSIPLSNITATGTGILHGWIDFDGDGVLESSEHASVNVNAGTPAAALEWTGQNTVAAASTFARFRLTTDTNINDTTPTGLAQDGEVEDYQVEIFTLTPDQLSCFAGSSPYSHMEIGQVSTSSATGALYSNITGNYVSVSITSSLSNILLAQTNTTNTHNWYNYGATAEFFDPDTQGYDILAHTNDGVYTYTFSEDVENPIVHVFSMGSSSRSITWDFTDLAGNPIEVTLRDGNPALSQPTSSSIAAAEGHGTIQLNDILGGFRVTATGGPEFWSGLLPATYCGEDFSDAPLSTTSYGGASHVLDSSIQLGTTISKDFTDFDDPTASADNDDGITVPSLAQGSTSYKISTTNISAVNNTGGNATLHAWIDFDNNGMFDASEYTSTNIDATGTATGDLEWSGIVVTAGNDTYARFRLTTDSSITNSTPDGTARNGEVEDYQVPIASDPNLLLVKRITAINRGGTDEQLFDTSYVNVGTASDEDNEANWPGGTAPATNGGTVESYISGIVNGTDSGVTIRPGDEIEYTIPFLSNGDVPAQDVVICDLIPTKTTFVPEAFNSLTPNFGGGGSRGILLSFNNETLAFTNANDGDEIPDTGSNDGIGGYYFPTGADPTAVFPGVNCNGTNDNGAVVVDLSSVPYATGEGTPNNSYGFIRFRVTVD